MTISNSLSLLSPPPDLCQECAIKHDLDEPHNPDSLYYNLWFKQQHDRVPTWTDAIAHCSPEVKAAWIESLAENGITAK